MTKKTRSIRFLSTLALLCILLFGFAQASAKNSGPATQAGPLSARSGAAQVSVQNTVSNNIYLPMLMNNYQSWSTNFADVTDLEVAGIHAYDGSAAIDTTNVNSGGKSIKVYGTIGSKGSCFNLNFGFWGFAGRDSVDLSQALLNMEIYLPADSPIFGLIIHVFLDNQFVVVRHAYDKMYKGQWHTYTVDLREDIALKTWRTYSYQTSPGLTDAQAVDVIKNAQMIAIVGVVQGDYTPAESYFLVDRLGWESAGPAPAYNSSVDSLRKYAQLKGLPMGGFLEPDGATEPEFLRNLVQEFDTTLAWSNFPATEPVGDNFSFAESWNPTPYADFFNEFYGFKLLRYAGGESNVWWIPDWLPGKSYAEAKTILENYTQALVDHYKGKTYIWILFNELLRYDLQTTPFTGFGLKDRNQPAPYTWGNNYSPWSSSPSDVTMIEEAFRVARAADPSALLFDNEAFTAAEGTRAGEAQYNLAAQLKSDGTPIDGVGFQCHIILDQTGNFHQSNISEPVLAFDPVYGFTDIAANVERYAALGLKVAFTEVDVSIYIADIDASTSAGQTLLAQRRQLQAAAYRSLLHIALTHPNVVAFNLFSWGDEYAWTDVTNPWAPPGFGNDLGLFDWFYQKKPSYNAVMAELKATQLPLPGPFNKVNPAAGATGQPTAPTLSWGGSAGATDYEYCLDTSNDNGCDTSWISAGTSTSVATSSLLPLTTYSWQVRAKGAGGVTHADNSSWRSFTTVSDWSTNFADVTDPTAVGFFTPGSSLAIDTINVNSGGKSIKVYGTIGQAGSQLNLSVGLEGLIGHDYYDFSEKTISYELDLPADSPLEYLNFFIFRGSQYVVIRALNEGEIHKGVWYTYTIDIRAVITLKSWKAASWMTSPGLTDEEAVDVLKNATIFTILGGVSTAHTPAPSYFLIDRLGWEASTP